jgi:L-alanine-DL-glutamate epimerase-like enolase superfamily enzyme
VPKVRHLSAAPLDARLHKAFGISGGAQDAVRNAIVRVELDDGTLGHGEAAPFPAFNGETREATMTALEAARPSVEGRQVEAWEAIARDLDRTLGTRGTGAARCAIETALLDALARHRDVSLHALFGAAEPHLVTDVTITTGTVAEAEDEARAWSTRGFSRLKVKIGAATLAEDEERVRAIHRAAPHAELILDGNGALAASDAIALARSLASAGIVPVLFEQPVPGDDLRELAEVTRACGLRVAADESCASAHDARRIAEAGAAHVVNVKPMKAGFAEARAIVSIAKRAGLGLMIGGMVEGKMAMSASACFAAGLGGFDFVDLDTPLFFADDPFEGGYAQEGERIDLAPIRAGHGVVPRANRRGEGPF